MTKEKLEVIVMCILMVFIIVWVPIAMYVFAEDSCSDRWYWKDTSFNVYQWCMVKYWDKYVNEQFIRLNDSIND